MHLTTSALLLTSSLHLYQSFTSFFLKPTLLMLSSTCSLHFIFGLPCLHFPFTSCAIAFIKISSSGHLKTSPYHFTPFTLASLSAGSFNPNMSISFSVLLLSIYFTGCRHSPWTTLKCDISINSE